MTTNRTFRHAHLACGIGSGARGFNMANPRIGNVSARFECAGGIDVDAGAIRNFEKLTGVKGTVMDLFSAEQYVAFHGKVPPPDWREAAPADIVAAFGPHLDVCFASMPCKGFSGLLSQKQSETDKYQALNGLTLRGIWLLLEAYKDDPIPIVLFENVPRIANRGRWLLDQIVAILRGYGYAVAETVHDCGELGGLAQSRKRFLLIARHQEKVPPFVYQPPKRKLRGVGEVIGKLPLPGDPLAGPMHRVPSLQWQTWVRLAFVPAGKDWRALNDLAVEGGHLRDFGIVPDAPLRENALGVVGWDETAGVVTSQRAPGQGRFSVADPRPVDCRSGSFGVTGYEETVGTVQGESLPSNGKFAVADPRIQTDREGTGRLGVRSWEEPSGTVAGCSRVENGAYSVADPRPSYGEATHRNVLGVKGWEETAGVVTGNPKPSGGAHCVADPRVNGHDRSVQMGVRPWDEPAPCVKGQMPPGGGPYAVADPRLAGRARFNNTFRIVRFDEPSAAVAGPGGPAGGHCVADPRMPKQDYAKRKYKVAAYDQPTRAVIGASTTGDGAFAVADPRPRCLNADGREGYSTQGHYGVVQWTEPSGSVPAFAKNNNGSWSVADPRDVALDVEPVPLPKAKDRLVCRIVALDDTWHRPFTTLELASLQSIVDPEEAFEQDPDGNWRAKLPVDLAATSDATKREWIGNAVPSNASKAMAETIGETLLLASMGETFQLSAQEIWVKPLALALTVDTDQLAIRMDRGME
ncbi:MAG: DNA cytosine methyltransferase [Methylocystis sp.]|uniref:DNA cytosine methyltransferase n=1 Tax=Methylocystis sp. TaxID=1911079 RepID=UPI003DA49F20